MEHAGGGGWRTRWLTWRRRFACDGVFGFHSEAVEASNSAGAWRFSGWGRCWAGFCGARTEYKAAMAAELKSPAIFD